MVVHGGCTGLCGESVPLCRVKSIRIAASAVMYSWNGHVASIVSKICFWKTKFWWWEDSRVPGRYCCGIKWKYLGGTVFKIKTMWCLVPRSFAKKNVFDKFFIKLVDMRYLQEKLCLNFQKNSFFNKDIEMSYIILVYFIFTLDSKPLSRAYLPQPITYLQMSYLLVWSCEYNSKCTHGFVPGY